MIIFSLLAGGLTVFLLFICLGFYLIFFDQSRGQSQCDEITLNMAEALNIDDRIGQMNIIVEHARQLVYLSRQAGLAANSNQNTAIWAPLADQLLTEAKEGAALVEKERSNQIDIDIADCRRYAKNARKANKEQGSWILTWFIEDQLNVNQIEFGSVNNILSNVESPTAIADLHKFDLTKRYVEDRTNLYYGNINAALPQPDEKLAFYLSALPASVENTNSPARLINSGAFVPSALIFDGSMPSLVKPAQLPGAVRVSGNMHIKTDRKDGKIDIGVNSFASAPGALSSP
jgi:hypothetical protein